MSDGTYIYVISPRVRGKTGPVKVGIANSPKKRLSQLQSGSPVGLEMFVQYWCPDRAKAASLEKHMHEHWSGLRLHGEWFAISPERAAQTINLQIMMIVFAEAETPSDRRSLAEMSGLLDLGGGEFLPHDFFEGESS